MFIPEEMHLESIRDAEEEYARRHNGRPFDLSHWDPGPKFTNMIRPFLTSPDNENPFDYIYASDIPDLSNLTEHLHLNTDQFRTCVAPSSTAAQLLVAFVLKALGVRRIHLVSPHYFATTYALKGVGLEIVPLPLRRVEGRFEFGPLSVSTTSEEAIWCTDPVFTMGVDVSENDERQLFGACKAGCWLVSDQTLARPGTGLAQKIDVPERLISIHSPHKAICVNGMKFSAVGYPKHLDDCFWQWSDIVFGGLGMSNLAAARHFLSSHFSDALQSAEEQACETREFCQHIASTFDAVQWSAATTGVFGSFLFAQLPANLVDQPADLLRIIDGTGASFISGTRNNVPSDFGFSFRINIARDGPQFRGSLARLLSFLVGVRR